MGLHIVRPVALWCPSLKNSKNKIEIEDIDVDEVDPIVLTNYKIRNIPVLVLLQDNKEVWRHVGSISKVELEDKIKEYEAN